MLASSILIAGMQHFSVCVEFVSSEIFFLIVKYESSICVTYEALKHMSVVEKNPALY